jgi:hypothetical protein
MFALARLLKICSRVLLSEEIEWSHGLNVMARHKLRPYGLDFSQTVLLPLNISEKTEKKSNHKRRLAFTTD